MEPRVLISVVNAELCTQLRRFLREQGFVLAEAPTEGGLLGTGGQRADFDLVLADTCTKSSRTLVRKTLLDLPAVKLLLICSEPDYIGRSLIPDPRVAFIETPFAWCELRAKIAEMMRGSGMAYAG